MWNSLLYIMDVTMSSTSNTSNAFVLGSIFNPTCVYLQTNKHVTKRSLTLQLYAPDSDFFQEICLLHLTLTQ